MIDIVDIVGTLNMERRSWNFNLTIEGRQKCDRKLELFWKWWDPVKPNGHTWLAVGPGGEIALRRWHRRLHQQRRVGADRRSRQPHPSTLQVIFFGQISKPLQLFKFERFPFDRVEIGLLATRSQLLRCPSSSQSTPYQLEKPKLNLLDNQFFWYFYRYIPTFADFFTK